MIYNMRLKSEALDYAKERDAAKDAYQNKVFNYQKSIQETKDERWEADLALRKEAAARDQASFAKLMEYFNNPDR